MGIFLNRFREEVCAELKLASASSLSELIDITQLIDEKNLVVIKGRIRGNARIGNYSRGLSSSRSNSDWRN